MSEEGESNMCEHGRLKYVGHKGVTRVFCAVCGKELDKTILEAENSAKKPSDDTGTVKATARKRTAKKAV